MTILHRIWILLALFAVLTVPLGPAVAMEKRGYKSAVKQADFADVLQKCEGRHR